MIHRISLCLLMFAAIFFGCSDKSVTTIETGRIEGTVLKKNHPVANAYIFWKDSLMTTTDENGNYQIIDLEEGKQELLCSALFAKDTLVQTNVKANSANTLNFFLTPDSTIGRIYGEFQDLQLFNQKLSDVEGMEDWDEKGVYEGTTGASICVKWVALDSTECVVSLGDSILVYDDGWGQYWFKMQIGTYPITGSSEGYQSKTHIVTILPEPDKTYCNFYLNRE